MRLVCGKRRSLRREFIGKMKLARRVPLHLADKPPGVWGLAPTPALRDSDIVDQARLSEPCRAEQPRNRAR